MKLSIEWERPVALQNGIRKNLIYLVDLNKLKQAAGIYVFGRKWEKRVEALYVGKANNIRQRVKSQLNNLRLMQYLKKAKMGKRFLIHGRVLTKPGQNLDKVLVLLERALIRHFLSEGHDLVNKQGVRLRRHEVSSEGRQPRRFIPKVMYLVKAKGE